VEEFLTALSAIPTISLLVTMRGTQRPSGPKWSKVISLGTFDAASARAAFMSFSSQYLDDPVVDQLLHAVGCLPLSIGILGPMAQYQPASFLLDRYETEGISMLSSGTTRSTSLDISIQQSMSCGFMKDNHHSVSVLRKLASLQSPMTRSQCLKAVEWQLSEPIVQKCFTSILQSSLAIVDDERNIHVPPFIQDYLTYHSTSL
jgi:hypothetical protein